MSGRPAINWSVGLVVFTSGGGFAGEPGAIPGHNGSVKWPGAGCHAGACAEAVASDAASKQEMNAGIRFKGRFSSELDSQR
jgi:hypothetical protein